MFQSATLLIMRGIAFALPLYAALAWLTPQAEAQNMLFLEARDLPGDCANAVNCLDRSTVALRNILTLTPTERATLLHTLNEVSTRRGLPDQMCTAPEPTPESLVPLLHSLPIADKSERLVDHPGVYFDASSIAEAGETAGFSETIIARLRAGGVRLLTEEARDATPGRPTLTLRFYARRESAGCIIPFSVSMALKEETVLVRNPALKVSGTIWSRSAREDLTNLHFTPMIALEEALTIFIEDWQTANPDG